MQISDMKLNNQVSVHSCTCESYTYLVYIHDLFTVTTSVVIITLYPNCYRRYVGGSVVAL